MSTNLPPNISDLRPRITVIGVGGAGCNAINNMIDASLKGVDFVVANTDAQALAVSQAGHKVQLGVKLTEGLGAGSRPEIGEAAAEEALDEIRQVVAGSHMVFVAAGMGGGTGTGAASVIARTAKELGILTVAVVTKPFQFEGTRRMRIAEAGIAELRQHVDTLIVIPNQNLFRIASDRTTFAEAFVLADQVLYSGVACIVDLIVKEGLINLDFADVRTVMSGMGSAMMGTGEAAGEGRAIRAAEEAITNPLLDDVTLAGAKGLLLSITGGSNLTLYEVDEAATRVRQEVDPEANIIVGATFDDSLGDRVRVSIVASGMARQAEPARPAAAPEAARPAAPRQAPPPAAEFQPQSAPAAHAPFPRPPSSPQTYCQPQSYGGLASREQDLLAGALQQGGPEPAATPAPQAGGWLSHTAESRGEPPPIPMSSWHGPGDVEIEDLPRGTYGQPAYAPPPAAFGAPPRAAPASYEAFEPAPPAEVRRAPRRMPDVEDFPVIGQREYYAKSGQASSDALGYSQGPTHPAAAEPRKRGFFDRLTGRGRRESDSHADRRDSPVTASGKAPQQSRHTGSDNAGYESRQSRSDEASAGAEKPELPVFFSKNRR